MRVLAVDGGQSGIRLRGSDDPRTVEVEGVGRLEGDTVAQLADGVARAWAQGAFDTPDRVVLGLTTAPSERTEAERLGVLVAATTGAREVWVADDAVTAHAGALSGGWGVSLVAGTGVACLALPDGGEPRILGGHGFLLGDEGGGFWLGRRGLSAVLRAREGRGPDTGLAAAARRRFGDLDDLHVRVHDAPRPVPEIAAFAPDVLEAAGRGDEVAREIVDEAAHELATTVTAGVAWAAGERPPCRWPSAVACCWSRRRCGRASRRGSARRNGRLPCGSPTRRRSKGPCAWAWTTSPGRTPRSSPWSWRHDRE